MIKAKNIPECWSEGNTRKKCNFPSFFKNSVQYIAKIVSVGKSEERERERQHEEENAYWNLELNNN